MRLKAGEHHVLVSPEGGSIISWQWRSKFILGPARIMDIDGHLKTRGETHWCYPNFGETRFEGPWGRQPPHGFLRNTILHPRRLSEASAVFGPDDALSVLTTVEFCGIKTALRAHNPTSTPLPVLPALHPYFFVPPPGLLVIMGDQVVASAGTWGATRILERRGRRVYVRLLGIGTVEIKPGASSHVVLWSDRPNEYFGVELVFGEPGTYGTEKGGWLNSEALHCEVQFVFTPES